MNDSFAALVADLSRSIATDVAALHEPLTSSLRRAPIGFRVADEEFTLGPDGVSDGLAAAAVRLVATTDAVDRLVTGRVGLADAARHDPGFDVVGRPGDLAVADRALRLLVLGAVRSPDPDRFHHRIRSLCSPRPEGVRP